jgi:hypothetical protein
MAKDFGFVGNVEYRHVYSQTGGAQYGRGSTPANDLLTVYAEAFERDADPEDFSLAAMIAHECGHQILARHPRIARRVAGVSEASEEILASLLGAMICNDDADRVLLFAKGHGRIARPRPKREGGKPSATGIVGTVGSLVMIGTKKLSTIRQEIEKALASTGDDAIERLERDIVSAKRKGNGTEVMEGLKQFLESPPKRQRRQSRVGAKK